MAYVPGSYQAGLLRSGYTDNGDGSFTSPQGDKIRPLQSDVATAATSKLAGDALKAVQSGYGKNDPNFDPRYAMLSAEHNLNPTLAAQAFPQMPGTKTDAAGNFVDITPSFWEKYGPWLALAGVGGVMAAPLIAGAAGAAGGAAGASATPGAAIDLGAPIAGSVGSGVPAGLLGGSTAASSGVLGLASKVAGLGGGKMTLSDILDAAGKIGQVASGAASGAANGRIAQASAQQRQDQLALDAYNAQLAADRLNLAVPTTRAATAVRGDILANAQPFSWTGGSTNVNGIPVPTSSGGLSPALFSSATRALGAQLPKQALAAQTADQGNLASPPPSLTSLPQASPLDTILGAAGTIGSLAGGLNEARKPTSSITPTTSTPGTARDPVAEYLQWLKTGGRPGG